MYQDNAKAAALGGDIGIGEEGINLNQIWI